MHREMRLVLILVDVSIIANFRIAACYFYILARSGPDSRVESLQQDYLQMRVLELAPQVYVSGQVYEADLKLAAKQNVRTIVNNRPDDEVMGQPKSADLAKAAEELGMTFVHFPLESRSITQQAAEEFARACEKLERPLLIFSGSGVRSTKIWEMGES